MTHPRPIHRITKSHPLLVASTHQVRGLSDSPVARWAQRWKSLAASALLASMPVAQGPLTTGYGARPDSAPYAEQVFFTVDVTSTTGITITSIDVSLRDSAPTAGTVEVRHCLGDYRVVGTTMVGGAPPGGWVQFPAANVPLNVVSAGPGRSSHIHLPAGMPLLPGMNGLCLTFTGVSPLCSATPMPLRGAGADIWHGDAFSIPWTAQVPRFPPDYWRFDGALHFQTGVASLMGQAAERSDRGEGCYLRPLSFYEDRTELVSGGLAGSPLISSGANVQVVRMTPGSGGAMTPIGYQVDYIGSPTFFSTPPLAGRILLDRNNAAMQDDNYSAAIPIPGGGLPYPDGNGGVATASAIQVSTNGYVRLTLAAPSVPTSFQPAPSELLAGFPRFAPLWTDLYFPASPTAGVYFHSDMAGWVYVTWLHATPFPDVLRTSDINVQLAMHPASGVIEYRYASSTVAVGLPILPTLTGWSQGNTAVDPHSMGLVGASGVTRQNPENGGLALYCEWPVANERVGYTVSNIPVACSSLVVAYGLQALGGLPVGLFNPQQHGCFVYTDTMFLDFYMWPRVVPPVFRGDFLCPAWIGVSFTMQAAAFFDANGAIVSSNAVDLVIGR